MMNFKSLILTAGIAVTGIVASGASSANAALIVNTTNDATILGNTLLGGGITGSGFNYTGAANAAGTFTGGTSAIGINSGIVLTTGTASFAPGPNDDTGKGIDNGLLGDTDLNTLSGVTTFDASILTFDFTSNSSSLFFNFAFASEEYPEYVNDVVNDAFAFFVDGVNIALIPGTTTPVSINTVNGGFNNDISTASNPQYYIDNTGGQELQYDGRTSVFTAQLLNLAAGNHTIKIAIADGGDGVWDSAVFLEGGSFVATEPQEVPEPFTIIGTLVGGSAALRMRKNLKSSTKA
jgi:hypothetical protein